MTYLLCRLIGHLWWAVMHVVDRPRYWLPDTWRVWDVLTVAVGGCAERAARWWRRANGMR